MIFGLDYDGTYTADPSFWQQFIKMAKQYGHQVIIVTNRSPNETIDPLANSLVRVYYASGKPKRDVVPFRVDIWIDDMPILVDLGAKGLTHPSMMGIR